MQQFFIEDLSNPSLSKDQLHQVTKVLRMRDGDLMRLVDQKGSGAIFSVVSVEPFRVEFKESIVFHKKAYRLKLIASLIRSERLEWMIQKACESGVDEIVLYASDHGVVRDFGNRVDRKIQRLNTIALEACEQSYRQYPVSIRGIISKSDLEFEKGTLNLYGELGNHPHIVDVITKDHDISLLIGPEGGFSASERKVFASLDYQAISLGRNVYRAESASIAACNFVSLLDKD
jgi:16S rRNA (uracil1498-N3)-methyltransferase